MEHVYGVFGFDFSLELSTRPEKYLGELDVWNKAEAAMQGELDAYAKRSGKTWVLNPGDGAFYGPKIDIHISDALKRSYQCATIQLDFQLPLRFGLKFQGHGDEDEHPVIIHRAMLGSVERFMAILIEHTAGKWPLWISPRQAMVVPIAPAHNEYAQEVRNALHDAGFYADVDVTGKKFQKKVRESQLAQYNYILCVGDKERETRSVNVRTRDNEGHAEQAVELKKFIEDLQEKVKNHE